MNKSQFWWNFLRAALSCLLRCTRERRQEFLVKAVQYYLNYLQTFFPDSFVAKVAAACRPKARWCHHNECGAPPCPDQITATTLLLNIVQLQKPKSERGQRIVELYVAYSTTLEMLTCCIFDNSTASGTLSLWMVLHVRLPQG